VSRAYRRISNPGTTTAEAVDRSFLLGSGATFTKSVCGLTNVVAFVNSASESSRSSHDGSKSSTVRIADLGTVISDLMERWKHRVKLHDPPIARDAAEMRVRGFV
jgi:hypothetical protein